MLGSHPGWVPNPGEKLADALRREGFPVRLTSRRIQRVSRLLDSARSLIRWRREYDIVILMVYSGRAFLPVDLLSSLTHRLRKPLIMWLHGGNLPNFAVRFPGWTKRVLSRASACISPSGFLAEKLSHIAPEIQVIPNLIGLEEYPFRLRSDLEPRFLWMRTFHELYNPFMAVDALEQIGRQYPHAELTMAGQDRGLLAETRRYASGKGLSGRIRFPGFLSPSGKYNELARHDIFLNTNRVDNMPVSVIEAAACGLPIIATEVGGIPFLLKQEQTGLLVTEDCAEEMAAAATRLLENPALGQRLSANGRALAEESDWTQLRLKWQRIFSQVTRR